MKNIEYKIVGIGGNARVGKDSIADGFIEILKDNGISAQKISFANELKRSVDSFLIEQIGISAFTSDLEEKKLIRPFLVTWGTEIMRKINDDIWIEKIQESIDPNKVNIIPDMRFMNELNFIKDNKGLCLFLERPDVPPANEYEEKINPELRKECDVDFSMSKLEEPSLIKSVSGEILNNLTNEEIIKSWRATCH